MKENELVWLIEENTYAELLSLGAHFSTVRYSSGGIDYQVQVTNDDIEYLEGRAIDCD